MSDHSETIIIRKKISMKNSITNTLREQVQKEKISFYLTIKPLITFIKLKTRARIFSEKSGENIGIILAANATSAIKLANPAPLFL